MTSIFILLSVILISSVCAFVISLFNLTFIRNRKKRLYAFETLNLSLTVVITSSLFLSLFYLMGDK